jgi:hypothetical protein
MKAQRSDKMYVILVYDKDGALVAREVVRGWEIAISTMITTMREWIRRGATHWELTQETSRMY